jgi:hypothetical protein
MIENSALICEKMSVVFINFKNKNFVRFLGSHDLWLHFRPHSVYFFELNLKFLIDGHTTYINFLTNKFRFWALMTPDCISDHIYTFLSSA